MNWNDISQLLTENLALDRPPIGLHYQATRPDDAIGFKGEQGCLVALLKAVERGKVAAVSGDAGCFGGRFYCGFSGKPRPEQAHFVSCVEHYIKTPELCNRIWSEFPPLDASGKWLIFQRLHEYRGSLEPEVAVFLAKPDSIAGLHFLACYDKGVDGVIAPFASGCGSIIAFPRMEARQGTHRAVLGLFDPSARAVEDPAVLSFAVDATRLKEMAANVGECFLQHDAWKKIRGQVRPRMIRRRCTFSA